MKFRFQIGFVLLLIAIVAPTVLAQTSAEKDSRASQVAGLLAPSTDLTGVGGLPNPAANANPSASKESKPTAVESVRNSLRAGIASLNAGRYKEAKASFEAAGQLAPHSSVVHTWLGYAYLGLDEYENSIKAYERALLLGSTSFETRRALGICYLRLGKPEQAITPLEEATRLEP